MTTRSGPISPTCYLCVRATTSTSKKVHRNQSHGHYPFPSDKKNWCILCRKDVCWIQAKGTPRSINAVSLQCHCASPYQQVCKKKCWFMWHSAQNLVPRHVGTVQKRNSAVEESGPIQAPAVGNVSRSVNVSAFTAPNDTLTSTRTIAGRNGSTAVDSVTGSDRQCPRRDGDGDVVKTTCRVRHILQVTDISDDDVQQIRYVTTVMAVPLDPDIPIQRRQSP